MRDARNFRQVAMPGAFPGVRPLSPFPHAHAIAKSLPANTALGRRMEVFYLEILREALGKTKVRLTVEELQSKLQSLDCFDELMDDPTLRSRRGRAFLRTWLDRIKDLWNYTPRSIYGGLRPTEKFDELLDSGATMEELNAIPVIVPSDFFL